MRFYLLHLIVEQLNVQVGKAFQPKFIFIYNLVKSVFKQPKLVNLLLLQLKPLRCQDSGVEFCQNLVMECEDTDDHFECTKCQEGARFYADQQFGCRSMITSFFFLFAKH